MIALHSAVMIAFHSVVTIASHSVVMIAFHKVMLFFTCCVAIEVTITFSDRRTLLVREETQIPKL
jgi:hypothetical protein